MQRPPAPPRPPTPVATPKSLWPWKCTGTSDEPSTVWPTSSATASGEAIPSVSTTTTSLRPRLDGGLIDLVVETALGAVESTPKNAAWMPCSAAKRIALVIRSSIFSRVTPIASSFRSEIGDSITENEHAELDERLEVGRHGAGEAPDLGAQTGGRDQLDRLPVVVGDARETGLDPVDAELVEQLCDLELLVRVEHHADRLLAVAQRRVVQADLSPDRVRVVQRPGPDQLRHGRPRPGTARASRRPSSVIRKLSSTRRPPPPSQ